MEQTQIKEIETLLKDVGEKVDKANEIARLKGENFNIFTILGVETKENKTHSNFLVSLLNPKGSHGMGSTFLNLFYDELDNINLTSDKEDILKLMKFEDATIRAEENLGNVDYINESGGRVDITIKSSVGNIFIENKIHAGDQHLQIARYCENHIEEKNIVLYLTLDGKKPSESSSGKNYNLDEDFFLLSYQTNIINWLEKCQKEASDLPIIRETIKQYIILIKKLTGQLTSQEMGNEIIGLIKKNISIAEKISSLVGKAKYEIGLEKYSETFKLLENKLDIPHIISLRREWTDMLFIGLIEHEKYEIGINLELRNNYFFFCAIQKGKKRQASINKRKELSEISTFLISNLNENNIVTNLKDYALAGNIKLDTSFESVTNNKYNDFSKNLSKQIKDVIDKSDIYNFDNTKN